jgi:quercetin dioxygenase-like cupin family protein
MPEEQRPIVLDAGRGETIRGQAGGQLTFKARGAATAGALTAFENVVAPGDGPPLHTHDSEGESWYVLEGTLRFKLGAEIHAAPAGAFVYVPPGTPHCFQNVGNAPARILVLFTPAGMERFFDRFAELPAGRVEPATFAELGRDAGMTVLGPPLAVSDPVSG